MHNFAFIRKKKSYQHSICFSMAFFPFSLYFSLILFAFLSLTAQLRKSIQLIFHLECNIMVFLFSHLFVYIPIYIIHHRSYHTLYPCYIALILLLYIRYALKINNVIYALSSSKNRKKAFFGQKCPNAHRIFFAHTKYLWKPHPTGTRHQRHERTKNHRNARFLIWSHTHYILYIYIYIFRYFHTTTLYVHVLFMFTRTVKV